jgi:uncharacterized repeat protein (TIGR03803 family)
LSSLSHGFRQVNSIFPAAHRRRSFKGNHDMSKFRSCISRIGFGAALLTTAVVPGMAQTATISQFYGFSNSWYTYPTLADGSTPEGSLFRASDNNFYGATSRGGATGYGAFYKVTPAGVETPIYNFTGGANGAWPNGPLIQNPTTGAFYGVTEGANLTESGTVYKITSSGVMTVLHTFPTSSLTDGVSPTGGLVKAADGNYYGVTAQGGVYNTGTIYRITEGGVETVLYSFQGDYYSEGPVQGLILNPNGYMYGVSYTTGTGDCGQIFRVNTAGAVTIVHTFNTTDGYAPASKLFLAKNGLMYGMTYSGGTYGKGTIYALSAAGSFVSLYSFAGGADGAYPWGGLYQTEDGALYGTTRNGGANDYGTLFRYNIATHAHTVLYSAFDTSNTGVGGSPLGDLVAGTDNNLYGTAVWGGSHQDGSAYKIALSPYITSLTNSLTAVSLNAGQQTTIVAKAYDQHHTLLASQPAVTWQTTGGGTVVISGNSVTFTAGATPGSYTLTSSYNNGVVSFSSTTVITVH